MEQVCIYNVSPQFINIMGKISYIKFVGMDVHQKSFSIAIADNGPDGEVRLYGTIKNSAEAIDKVVRKLVSTGAELHFDYEAGPCGFGLNILDDYKTTYTLKPLSSNNPPV